MLKHKSSGALLLFILGLNAPAFAADISSSEAKIQSKIQADYEAGRIDEERYSSLQSNLDQLKEQEADLRSRGGMTTSATSDMLQKLDDLDADVSGKSKQAAETKDKKAGAETKVTKEKGDKPKPKPEPESE